MSGEDDTRTQALTHLAKELDSLARGYRGLNSEVRYPYHYGCVPILCGNVRTYREHVDRELRHSRAMELADTVNSASRIAADLGLDLQLATSSSLDAIANRWRINFDNQFDRAAAYLAHELAAACRVVRRHARRCHGDSRSAQETTVEHCVLNCLARALPAAERTRFVSEEHGNLGACDRWWQRIDHLACLAIGMPRLARMMRR